MLMTPSFSPQALNATWQEGDLFTWHGAELIFTSVMMVTGIVGNLFVLYIYHFRWRSNTVTLIKRMLAILDLASLILAYPALIYVTVWPHGNSFQAACIFTSVIALGTAIASGGVLMIIAVDRFMRLCLLRKTGLGTKMSTRLCAASVVFAGIFTIPCGWVFGRTTTYFTDYKVKVTHCFISSESKYSNLTIAYNISIAAVFLVVCTTLVVLYYKIIKTLRQLSNKHEELRYQNSITRRMESFRRQTQSDVMKNSAIVFIAVTVVFFASYSPYLVTFVVSLCETSNETRMNPTLKALYDLAKFSPLVNNMANPIIYSFTSDNFREEVKQMLTLKTCKDGFFQRRMCSFSCNLHELSTSTISKESSSYKQEMYILKS